jgi:transcriptional regulator with XRE-family HTH domain
MSKNRFQSLKLAIAAQIKQFLEESGWSQQDLADKLGKNKSHVSLILAGKQNLTLETISEIERVFDRKLLPIGK